MNCPFHQGHYLIGCPQCDAILKEKHMNKTTPEELARKCADLHYGKYYEQKRYFLIRDIEATIPLKELLDVARAANTVSMMVGTEHQIDRTNANIELMRKLGELQQKGIEL